MADNVSEDVRRKTMQAIRSQKTSFENRICKELWQRGLRFRRNVKDLKGKPDISIKKYKIAIFLDSCFWHGCPMHCRIPSSNIDYWHKKIERNRERDKLVNDHYLRNNWNLLRVWEHEAKSDFDKTVTKIMEFIIDVKNHK